MGIIDHHVGKLLYLLLPMVDGSKWIKSPTLFRVMVKGTLDYLVSIIIIILGLPFIKIAPSLNFPFNLLSPF
jgi:hypothetical protein